MARISRPMTNVALRLLAWVLSLSLIATCRATSPACEMTFDNAIESFASIDWYLCPPLSFRASMSGFCLSAGCNQASHAARSPSLAARHTLLIRIRLPNAQILVLWPWADVHLVRFSSGYPRRFFSSESSCRLQINC